MNNDPLDKFKKIYKENPSISKHRGRTTEADTRANVIDRVIHEILEWPRACVDREPFANPGFIDYLFTQGRPVLLLEAKAEGEYFIMPYKKNPRRNYKISGSLTTDKAINSAISQVQRYCSDIGCRFAAVTNGFTYIIFRAISEGRPWKDGQAIIFNDYNDIVSNFTEFWNLLSYEAVKDGKLDNEFRLHSSRIRSFYRPIEYIVDSDATYERNPFNAALRPFLDQFFGDIANQETVDVLKSCYVYSRPIQAIDKSLNLSIRDEIPKFVSIAKQIQLNDERDGGSVGEKIQKTIIGRPANGAVVLIMGGIGSGKSTFCKRFFKIVASDIIEENGPAMLLFLDFLGAPDNPDQLNSHLWDTAANSIKRSNPSYVKRKKLEEIFQADIQIIEEIYANDKNIDEKINDKILSLYENGKKFVESALYYSAKNEKLPIVVFDNVDQLNFNSQIQIFTSAHNLSSNFGCLSIIVLREESYSTAIMKKHLTAYTVHPFHLSSPKFDILLKLRINLAVREAVNRADNKDAKEEEKLYAGIVQLFGLLRESILGKNKNIIRLVSSIAYGNMRLALDLFNSFITSGATNVLKILNAYKESGNYVVPFHEFIKSVMLGDYRYYKEERSLIFNLFNTTKHTNSSHFTALRILQYLHAKGKGKSDDFINLQPLLTDIVDVFKNESDCKQTILNLISVDRQLVELDSRRPDTLDGASSARITASGIYYLQFMVNSFQYCDLVWHDTAFSQRGICDEMKSLIHKTDMEIRFNRVEKFLDYLEREEIQELAEQGIDADIPFFCGPFIPNVKKYYLKEKGLISNKLGI